MVKPQWIGAALLLVAIAATGTNERWLIRHTKSLEEGLRRVVVLPEPVSTAQNDGKLVLISGRITTDPSVMDSEATATRTPYVLDPVFGVAARGVRLYRTVEMLQWVETAHTSVTSSPGGVEDDRDGGVDEHREKTYIYDLRWRAERVDSLNFHDLSYQNPSDDAWIFKSKVVDAEAVVVGDFKLSHELIDQIQRKDAVALDTESLKTMRNVLQQRIGKDWEKSSALKDVTVEDKYFYLLRDGAGRPSLGDLRVSFSVNPPYPVTISGKQEMQHILPFRTSVGEIILLLEDGTLSAAELFESKISIRYKHNRFYRLFTVVLGFIGFLVLHPVLRQRFGPIFSAPQKHLLSLLLSGGMAFSVAGLSWLFHRPLYALGLTVGGLSPLLTMFAFVMKPSSLTATPRDDDKRE